MHNVCDKKYCLRFFTRTYDSMGYVLDETLLAQFNHTHLPLIPRIGETVMLEDIIPQIYKVTGVEYSYPYQDVEDDAREYDICVIVEETD